MESFNSILIVSKLGVSTVPGQKKETSKCFEHDGKSKELHISRISMRVKGRCVKVSAQFYWRINFVLKVHTVSP